MTTQEYLKRSEAAKRCGVSVDTIRRAQADQRFPNAIQKDNTWMIPLADLVYAGLLDLSDSRSERVLRSDETEPAQQTIAHLTELLEREREDVANLRSLLSVLTAAGAAL